MIPQSQCCPSGIERTYGGFIIANEWGETNVDGFYAVGDIRHKMLRQAITAAADGANCISAIEEYLLEKYKPLDISVKRPAPHYCL